MKRGPARNPRLEAAIGVCIYRERLRQRLTLRILADRAGMHLNTLDNAESGRGISLEGLCRIAAALKVGLDALVPAIESFVGSEAKDAKRTEKAAKVIDGTQSLFQ